MRHSIILVSLDWIRPGDPRTSLGTASIASSLRAHGVGVEIVADAVNRPGFDADGFVRRVEQAVGDAEPDTLVGIGAFVWNEPEVQALVRALRGRARLVLGGPQVSYAPAGSLEQSYPGVDIFVRGHGECAMVALALGAAGRGEPGIHVAGEADRGLRADDDLEGLPSPHLDGTLPIGRFVRWETQRGCPYRCSFCQHREPGPRLRRREFGDGRLHDEMRAFAAAAPQRIAVLDPVFHANRTRAVSILHALRDCGTKSELALQCRFELVDAPFLDALEGLDVVLEFGLQTVHRDEARAVGRLNDMDRIAAVVARLHERSIPFEVSLIYGLPRQTLDSFRRSVDWCLDHGVPRVRAWPLMLLRGTPLHEQRAGWGFVESDDRRIPVVVASDSFSREDNEEMARIAAFLEARTFPNTRVA